MGVLALSLATVVAVMALGAVLWYERRRRRELLHSLRQLGLLVLRRAEETQETHRLLDALLAHAPGLFVITDRRRVIQNISPGAADLLGTAAEDAVGQSLMAVARDHDLNDMVGRSLESAELREDVLEYRPAHRVLQVRVLPTRGSRNEVSGAILVMQDISDIRRLERVRQEFVSNISHELRTPLASIKALVETLQEGALQEPATAEDFMRRIVVEVDHLTQLVNELSLLSNIESGLAPLERRPTDLAEMVRGAVERLTPQAARGGSTMSAEVPEGLPLAMADPARMEQALVNLLHNAIKFTPSGGSITVGIRQRDGELEVGVQDTGVGIPAEDLPRVFERFYKVDKARSREGAGLGLSLVKHIVLSHGGRVWAESQEGRGSTFFFTVPTARVAEAPDRREP